MDVKRLNQSKAVEPLRLVAMLSLTVAAAAGIFALHTVSKDAADILTAWTLASFPIGVLVGHCVLREK
ncbi:hypothetical protein [Rhodopila sp.]|uniref:hypothetical protein n=1 Tax=Rhodopila sp. TaxID=2480087 RepID=UPI003D0AF712